MEWQMTDAKNRFSGVMNRALYEGPQRVRCRKEAVIVMAEAEYERLAGVRPGFKEYLMQGEDLDGVLRDTCMMAEERRAMLQHELGRQMSIISEEAFCSSWAWRIEDELPPLLAQAAMSQQPVLYKGAELSPLLVEWLVAMAQELGHWVTVGAGGEYIPHTPKDNRSELPA